MCSWMMCLAGLIQYGVCVDVWKICLWMSLGVWSVGVVVGGGVLEEVFGYALAGEGKRGKRLVEKGGGGGNEGGFTLRTWRMMGSVVGVVVVQFVGGGVRVEDGG